MQIEKSSGHSWPKYHLGGKVT